MHRRGTLLIVLLVVAASCRPAADPTGSEPAATDGGAAGEPGLVVLTTVDPITDLARHVLGDRGQAQSLVGDGDSHTFEPTSAEVILMEQADLFLANGLGLDDAAIALAAANLPEGAPIVTLADLTLGSDDIVYSEHPDTSEQRADTPGEAQLNPHAWMNVAYAIAYVGHIADALTELDPESADAYQEHARAYTGELEALDTAIMAATATIPEDDRVLVSYHDSWVYYAQRYGLDHIDAIQPSDHAEPSASEVRTIIDEINTHDVPVVFGAREFPNDVLRTIAAETGADYISDLSDDTFPGAPGDPEHSYIGMMVDNARAITEGLGGDTSALDAVDPRAG